MKEIEAKILEIDPEELRGKLENIGASKIFDENFRRVVYNFEDGRSGFQEATVEARIDTEADEETEREIVGEAEGRGPISDNFQHEAELNLEIR